MPKMHVHDVYAEDYDGLPSDIVAVKDAELQGIDIDCLITTLRRAGWGDAEISVIALTLVACGLERQKEARA